MQRIAFSLPKRRIAEFAAETIEFSREQNGLLVSAHGEMTFQDSEALQEVAGEGALCRVQIERDGEGVVDQPFRVTFFALEPDILVALLHNS